MPCLDTVIYSKVSDGAKKPHYSVCTDNPEHDDLVAYYKTLVRQELAAKGYAPETVTVIVEKGEGSQHGAEVLNKGKAK